MDKGGIHKEIYSIFDILFYETVKGKACMTYGENTEICYSWMLGTQALILSLYIVFHLIELHNKILKYEKIKRATYSNKKERKY